MENRSISPWEVDQWPNEASAEDIEEARHALADEADEEPVDDIVLATIVGVTRRSVFRWRNEGCSGPAAVAIHAILWFETNEVRTGGC